MLDYEETYPNVFTQYHGSDMILYVDNNSAYLVLPKACSHISGHFYLSDCPPTNDTPNPKLNGHILTIFQKLKHVVASSA